MMLDRALVYDRAYVALTRVKNLKEMRMTAQVQPHKTSSYLLFIVSRLPRRKIMIEY